MAQFRKQGPKLPPPPPMDEVSNNLRAPEVAPAPLNDGRSARATGRTKPLATRVREEFHDELKQYAAAHRLKLVEVLERAFDALKKSS